MYIEPKKLDVYSIQTLDVKKESFGADYSYIS